MRRTRRDAGFSLAEMLLALLLLSVGVLALIGVFTGGLNLMSRSEEITSATQVGRNVMEQIKQMDPALIPDNADFDGTVAANASGFPPAPYPNIERQGRNFDLRVQTERKGPHSVSVLVTVSWQDGGPLKFETYIAK